MASMKTCPSCGTDVPTAANRCKECFHDFSEVKKTNYQLPLLVLGSLAAMAVSAAIALFVALQVPVDSQLLVDQGSKSVTWVTKYRGSVQTDRVMFDDITRVEHRTSSGGDHEVVVVLKGGGHRVLETSTSAPLVTKAQEYADALGKPLEQVDDSGGFMKKP